MANPERSVTRIALVDECTHDGVPNDVCHITHQEHHGHCRRRQSVDVGVEEQQISTNDLKDQILRQVTGTETDALYPVELIKAF